MKETQNKLKKREIPFSVPFIDQEEIDNVVKVLKSKWITTGSEVQHFEELVKAYLGVNVAIALASGTAALELALVYHGVGSGHQVMTTAYTFVSTVLTIIHQGAEPVFADVEADTFNIDPRCIQQTIDTQYRPVAAGLECKRSGKILRGITVVHFAGQPAQMDEINRIARKYGLFVVEDAAHALGAQQGGVKIGKSDNPVCFSFYSNKNLTTGEGGMIVTDNADCEKKLRMYALHGISKSNRERYRDGLPFYDVLYPGYKANLTDIQAALGTVQMRKLETITLLRNRIASWYDRMLADLPEIITPRIRDHNQSARHLYPILLAPGLHERRDDVIIKLRQVGIYPSVHFIPVHFHTYFKEYLDVSNRPLHLPVTEDLFRREISLPIYPEMTEDDTQYVAQALREIIGQPGIKN